MRKLKAYRDLLYIRSYRPETYKRAFTDLLTAEFAYKELCYRIFDEIDVRVSIEENPKLEKPLNKIHFPYVSNSSPSLAYFDYVILTEEKFGRHMLCTIKRVDSKNHVWFALGSKGYECAPEGYYLVRFASYGLVVRRAKEAVSNRNLVCRLLNNSRRVQFDLPKLERLSKAISATDKAQLDARLNNLNAKQRRAVRQILRGECRPKPYILFGPPGTGKTSTLVELVVQIFSRTRDECRVLVTSSSNSCVDHLAQKLWETNQIDSMVRLISMNHSDRKRRHKESRDDPAYLTTDVLVARDYRVVVTTNFMAGGKRFPSHFDWVIVDEAGHASEPEACIPLTRCKQDGVIVLAGDRKQLGPVIMSAQADDLGLGRSMLDRLQSEGSSVYKMCGINTNAFDERYISKLQVCYRSDARVMHISNEMFYQGALECVGRTPAGLLRLMRFREPLRFIDVPNGLHLESNGTLSNELEAQVCVDQIVGLYRMGLEPHQVCVITPYKWQRRVIADRLLKRLERENAKLNERFKLSPEHVRELKRNAKATRLTRTKNLAWSSCKINTVDAFQGDEREVVIVSTVRTRGSLYFIEDNRRFNVTMSRARWATSVVGHRKTLINSQKWAQFINLAENVT